MVKISTGLFGFAEAHPVLYLSIDLAFFLIAASFFLFLKDIQDYFEVRPPAAHSPAVDSPAVCRPCPCAERVCRACASSVDARATCHRSHKR